MPQLLTYGLSFYDVFWFPAFNYISFCSRIKYILFPLYSQSFDIY